MANRVSDFVKLTEQANGLYSSRLQVEVGRLYAQLTPQEQREARQVFAQKLRAAAESFPEQKKSACLKMLENGLLPLNNLSGISIETGETRRYADAWACR